MTRRLMKRKHSNKNLLEKLTKAQDLLVSRIMPIISEEKGGPTSKILAVDFQLFVQKDASVTDTMTLIRVLPSVAVVGQTDHSLRSKRGRTVLPVSIKFLPGPGGLDTNLETLAQRLKSISAIEIVRIAKVNDREYRKSDGSPYIF